MIIVVAPVVETVIVPVVRVVVMMSKPIILVIAWSIIVVDPVYMPGVVCDGRLRTARDMRSRGGLRGGRGGSQADSQGSRRDDTSHDPGGPEPEFRIHGVLLDRHELDVGPMCEFFSHELRDA